MRPNVRQTTNQSFDCTAFILKSQLCMVMSCTYFGPRHSSYSTYLCRAPGIEVLGTTFNVFGYDAVLGRDKSYHLPDNERMLRALPNRGLIYLPQNYPCICETYLRSCTTLGIDDRLQFSRQRYTVSEIEFLQQRIYFINCKSPSEYFYVVP